MPYPTNQPTMGYPTTQYPPSGPPYPSQGGMPQPYPVVSSTYPNQPPYMPPQMGSQPPPMYTQHPGYQTHPPAAYGYPAYQQQQYYQVIGTKYFLS